MARVLRHDSRLSAMCERVVCASLERGRQMEELRIVSAGSRWGRGEETLTHILLHEPDRLRKGSGKLYIQAVSIKMSLAG